MASHRIHEETRNVVIASLAVWGSLVAGAALEGLFTKFDATSVAAFAVGVALYALAAYRLDRGMREFILKLSRGAIVAFACLAVAILVGASIRHVPALAVFAAPLAVVACAAAFERLATSPRKEPAKSPGVSRAAT
jgi:peptidoglycan/LPS O-acetylase OafA/YrhL